MKIYNVKVNGKTYRVELDSIENVASAAKVEAKKEEAPQANVVNSAPVVEGEGNKIVSPIQGTVVNVKVSVGQKVKKGDVVAIVEAMKLENEIVSSFDGVVSNVLVSKGQNVTAKQTMFVVK